jgi:hypothetical protein
MTSSGLSHSIVYVAGATISVGWGGSDIERRREFEAAWKDVLISRRIDSDGSVSAADHPRPADLEVAIRRAARVALETRDVWTIRGAAIADAESATIILSEQVDDRLSAVQGANGQKFSLGHELVSIDAQGAVLSYREPVDSVPPSAIDGRGTVPGGIRVGAFVVVDRSSGPAQRLGLRDSLIALMPYVEGFGGTPAPLRSLARIVAAAGRVLRVNRDDLDRVDVLLAGDRSTARRPMEIPGSSLANDKRDAQGEIGAALCYRAGAVAALDFMDDGVLLLLRSETGHAARLLDRSESELWRAADGVERIVAVERASREGSAGQTAEMHKVQARLEHQGLLASEPSWHVSEAATWVIDGESTVVLDLASPLAQPLVLEGSAAAVWVVLVRRGSIPRRRLIEEVASDYDIAPDLIASDIDSLLARLRSENLVARS